MVQSCLFFAVLDVGVGAGRQQLPHHLCVAILGGTVERCLLVGVGEVDVGDGGPGVEEDLDHLGVSGPGRQVEGGGARLLYAEDPRIYMNSGTSYSTFAYKVPNENLTYVCNC